MRYAIYIVCLVSVTVVCILSALFLNRGEFELTTHRFATATISSTTVDLSIAQTPAERYSGLGGREYLEVNEGMLFIFDTPAQHAFWMKDMKFPIDILWFDEHFRVVHIESSVAPSTYPKTSFLPSENALYVVELKAGFSEKHNIKIGDLMKVNLNK